MKKTAIFLVLLFLVSQIYTMEGPKKERYFNLDNISCLDHVEIDFDDGSLFITDKDDSRSYIEITEDYELYLNGEQIQISGRDRKLVKSYYENYVMLLRKVEMLGYEGARIGVHGAKIGVKAIEGLVEAILSDYELKDLERDIEKEAENLERKAEKLENRAAELEEVADEIEKTHYSMKRNIPELNRLNWF